MQAALDRHIESTPGIRGGKPCLAGTRIAVADVALMHLRLDQSFEQIAARFDLALSAVHAAMAYYYDHRVEMDSQMSDEEAVLHAARSSNSSKLQARLQANRG